MLLKGSRDRRGANELGVKQIPPYLLAVHREGKKDHVSHKLSQQSVLFWSCLLRPGANQTQTLLCLDIGASPHCMGGGAEAQGRKHILER